MCDADDGCAETLVDEWRRARKIHRCYACHEEIRPGDRYHVVAQKEDKFFVAKHCARCWAMGEAILEAGAESWQYDLQCGVSWEEAFAVAVPADVAAMAFLTRDEAQALVAVQ